jgi:hypothetical protein
MGYEPGAARRLRLLCATSRDSQLRSILDLLGDDSMPSSPRELLLSTFDETGGGGPCDVSSTSSNTINTTSNNRPLGEGLEALTAGLSAEETAMALLALSEHAGALRLVWEAHARGAITLPPSVARRVAQARRAVPPFLGRDAGRDVSRDIVADAATVVVYPQAPSLGGAR